MATDAVDTIAEAICTVTHDREGTNVLQARRWARAWFTRDAASARTIEINRVLI